MYDLNCAEYKKGTLIKHKGIPLRAGGRLITPHYIVWWWPVNWVNCAFGFLILIMKAAKAYAANMKQKDENHIVESNKKVAVIAGVESNLDKAITDHITDASKKVSNSTPLDNTEALEALNSALRHEISTKMFVISEDAVETIRAALASQPKVC